MEARTGAEESGKEPKGENQHQEAKQGKDPRQEKESKQERDSKQNKESKQDKEPKQGKESKQTQESKQDKESKQGKESQHDERDKKEPPEKELKPISMSMSESKRESEPRTDEKQEEEMEKEREEVRQELRRLQAHIEALLQNVPLLATHSANRRFVALLFGLLYEFRATFYEALSQDIAYSVRCERLHAKTRRHENCIIVFSLHPELTEDLLFEYFLQFGNVRSVNIPFHTWTTPETCRYAIVEFRSSRGAETAAGTPGNRQLLGQRMTILQYSRGFQHIYPKIVVRGLDDLSLGLPDFVKAFNNTPDLVHVERDPISKSYVLYVLNASAKQNIVSSYKEFVYDQHHRAELIPTPESNAKTTASPWNSATRIASTAH